MELYEGKIFVLRRTTCTRICNRSHLKSDAKQVPKDPWLNPNLGFVGVWKITDNGDVPPLPKSKDRSAGFHPGGWQSIPKTERLRSASVRNGRFSFVAANFFGGRISFRSATAE